MVWRDNTDYARETIEWIDGFKKATGIDVETADPDTISGEIFATSHDVVQYPTLCVVDDASRMLAMWPGKMPQYEEVSYIMRNV